MGSWISKAKEQFSKWIQDIRISNALNKVQNGIALGIYVDEKVNKYKQNVLRGTEYSAGIDLPSPYGLIISPNQKHKIDMGIHFAIPPSCYGELELRSSFSNKGLDKLGGIIDSDYRGSIKLIINNTTSEAVEIKEGERICQIIIKKYEKLPVVLVGSADDLGKTERGERGFGSSGQYDLNGSTPVEKNKFQ